MLSFNALIWYRAPNSNSNGLIFKSGHKNILEPETSRICVFSSIWCCPTHTPAIKRATVESLTAGK